MTGRSSWPGTHDPDRPDGGRSHAGCIAVAPSRAKYLDGLAAWDSQAHRQTRIDGALRLDDYVAGWERGT